ncbi:hypothetical protein Tco_0930857 [Tanacetum coccineum]
MPSRMMKRSVGHATAAPQGGRTGGQVGGQGNEMNDGVDGDTLKLPHPLSMHKDTAAIINSTDLSSSMQPSHAAYTDRFHELARLVPHLVTPENKRIERYIYGLYPQIRGMVAAMEPTTIQRVVQKGGTWTDEAIRNGLLKKNPKKKLNSREPSKDRNARD